MGGLTTPGTEEIAEVAEKYKVPTVKVVTGYKASASTCSGARKKTCRPMWRDLICCPAFGHAMGKSIRQSKNPAWCRALPLWHQRSMDGGPAEKMLRARGVRIPVGSLVRATAPRPASRTLATGVDSGYELVCRRCNGGIKTEAAEFP